MEFYLNEINPQMSYQMVFDKLSARYNTTHRKLYLQSAVDSLYFNEFTARDQIQSEKESLRRMVEYHINIIPQLVDGFRT